MRTAVRAVQAGSVDGENEFEKVLSTKGQLVDWERNDARLRGKKGHVFNKGAAFLNEVLQFREHDSTASSSPD
eukprot:7559285-Alexandrium_andersonii.AAC.1